VFKCQRNRGRDFKEGPVSSVDNENKSAGRVVDHQENLAVIGQPAMPVLPAFDQKMPDRKGFSTEDILWSVGIWSVLLTMTPVIFIYMLMVA
jgi:hypothetical protein